MNVQQIEEDINNFIISAVNDLLKNDPAYAESISEIPPYEIGIPKEKKFGNLSTNIALKLSSKLQANPINISKSLVNILNEKLSVSKLKNTIGRFEAAPPGFVNIFFSENFLYETIKNINLSGDYFGKLDIGKERKVLLEFVSANPTGPLTVAHGRQAAVGDTLANILEFVNFKVTREYYNNDEGNQINTLGKSIMARSYELLGIPSQFPEDGYKGGYIYDIAKSINEKFGERLKKESFEFFAGLGLKIIMDGIIKDIEDFGVKFDVWYSQKSLRKSKKVEKALEGLRKKGYIYDNEGAVFFKSTEFGDDKDRVVIKSDGSLTYLGPDIAYHLDKFKRGFDMLIDIWGPDHHGYIPRIKASVEALGYGKDSLKVIIVQLATLYREGKVLSMSTRAGEFITLREIMDEVGKDAARFFFLMRKTDSHLDFDLELAKKHTLDNPVYYIQYAHARICNILKFKGDEKVKIDAKKAKLELLKTKEELDLIALLGRFPFAIKYAASELEPYRLVNYLIELATVFHSFYAKHRVVTDDISLTESRLMLSESVRIIINKGLKLLGVSAPEKM